jgi:hypothetical protein
MYGVNKKYSRPERTTRDVLKGQLIVAQDGSPGKRKEKKVKERKGIKRSTSPEGTKDSSQGGKSLGKMAKLRLRVP